MMPTDTEVDRLRAELERLRGLNKALTDKPEAKVIEAMFAQGAAMAETIKALRARAERAEQERDEANSSSGFWGRAAARATTRAENAERERDEASAPGWACRDCGYTGGGFTEVRYIDGDADVKCPCGSTCTGPVGETLQTIVGELDDASVRFTFAESRVKALEEAVRQQIKRCPQCYGRGQYTPSCMLCGDSTYDHHCDTSLRECGACAGLRAVAEAV
jgi:rubrerythrin